jgi:hypothetical protein
VDPGNWQTWSWKELRAPVYDVVLRPVYSDEDDEIDSMKPKKATTCTLSLITEPEEIKPPE